MASVRRLEALLLPAYWLVAQTFGYADADEVFAVAQLPLSCQAAVRLRPAMDIQQIDLSDGVMRVQALVDELLVPKVRSAVYDGHSDIVCRVSFPGGAWLDYPAYARSFNMLVDSWSTCDLDVTITPAVSPTVYTAKGTPLVWQRQARVQQQHAALAVEEGFTSVARAFQRGILSMGEAEAEVRKLLTPAAPEPPPVVRTRKIRID